MTNNEETLDQLSGKTLNDIEKQQVQVLLQAEPELWRSYGDLSSWTRDQALAIVDSDTVQYECTQAGIAHLRKQLLSDGTSDLEAIAVEQIITNYIQVAKTGYRLESIDPCKELDQIGKFRERRHHLAQGRLLRSMSLLTRLRKINLDILKKSRSYDMLPTILGPFVVTGDGNKPSE